MHFLDWLIIFSYLFYIVWDGIRRSHSTRHVRGYFLANQALPWWAIGLSIMATQMSAITLVGTTGQGYQDGMKFIQFYFGLPFAMIILCFTVVPFFRRSKVFTAYEFLEKRFDCRIRILTSFLFLVSRGISCGVIIAAPALILSIIFGWSLVLTVLIIGLPAVIYTMLGGVQAVTWADVKQMALILVGMTVVLYVLVDQFPQEVSFGGALKLAAASGRLETVDFSFDPSRTYTFWSGLLGGTFLMLSYFGCDQSQVQRYLTARSITEGRVALLLSALMKIPLQFLILLIGVLVFVFFNFSPAPLAFNPSILEESSTRPQFPELEARHRAVQDQLRQVATHMAIDVDGEIGKRSEYLELLDRRNKIRQELINLSGLEINDVNYIFPYFVTRHLPIGIAGVMIAAILAAAMSSISSELNALSASSVMDIYCRLVQREAPPSHYLWISKLVTVFWGIVASTVAVYSGQLGSLIEVVNLFGSFFYGSLLGVFVLGIGTNWVTSRAALVGLISGMLVVALFSLVTDYSFLWYNAVGVVTVCLIGFLVSSIETLFGCKGKA